MTVLYNEIEPYAVQWLRNLVDAGHIAPGRVDSRSIEEVQPDDVRGATQAHFFAGVGIWSHALRLAGWPDDLPVWTGSCPCQPFSAAGRHKGFDDSRHLWPEWFRLIRECRPPVVLGEQVASKDGLAWLDSVFTDMEGAGYACAAFDLCAAGVGAPHIRQRLYFASIRLAEPRSEGRIEVSANGGGGRSRGETQRVDKRPVHSSAWGDVEWLPCRDGRQRPTQPGLLPLADGATSRVGRLRAYGNGLVAPLAAEFCRAVLDTVRRS